MANPEKKLSQHDYLSKGCAASVRLDLQHYGWQALFQYHLHPFLPPANQPLRIADVATGTGLWAIELARERPSSTITGFDIDLGQTLTEKWLPSNLKTRQLDILGDLPDDLVGQFDVVNIRHIQIATTQPEVPLRNMAKMLKPGGWLQWGEWDLTTRYVNVSDPAFPGDKVKHMLHYADSLKPPTMQDDVLWPHKLQNYFTDAGMEFRGLDRRPDPPWLRATSTNTTITSYREVAARLPAEMANGLRKACDEAEQEIVDSRHALAITADAVLYIAQKAL